MPAQPPVMACLGLGQHGAHAATLLTGKLAACGKADGRTELVIQRALEELPRERTSAITA